MQRNYLKLVSILVLVDDSLEEYDRKLYFFCNLFQSLFSWMIRSKQCRDQVLAEHGGFQSLFSWMIRSKSPVTVTPGWEPSVSILVLVDDSLEAPVRKRDRCQSGVSILVLVDDSLEVCGGGISPGDAAVSILVLVDDSLEDRYKGINFSRLWPFQSLFSWMIRSKTS